MIINEKKQQSHDLIENILLTRGVNDIQLFLNPTPNDDDTSPYDFKNMEDGVKNILYHLSKGSKIVTLVDADADGFSSSAVLLQFLNSIIKEYDLPSTTEFIMQEGKQHGLNNDVIDKINKVAPDLIILPDSSTNDTQELSILSTMLYDVIVIDHHEITDESVLDIIENVIIINNQRSDNGNVNKSLTGAGMVYNFINVIFDYMQTDGVSRIPDPCRYLDLVALGQIGDVSDISNNEIRHMVFEGIAEVNNPFIRSVLKFKGINTNNITPQDLSFSIIPIINSITRVGTEVEKKRLFEAMIITKEENITESVFKRKLNKETRKYENVEFVETITDIVAEESAKVKTRQDSIVKKTMAKLDKETDNRQGVLVYVTDAIDNGSITGLVATKLSRKYDKPCLVLLPSGNKDSEDYGEYYSGSGRGIEKVMDSFKDWCDETELFEFAQGHANAFGVSIHSDHLKTLSRVVLGFEAKPSDTYEVDKKYNGTIVKEDVDLIISNKHIIGGKVEPALFGYENITIPKKYIQTRGKTIEFYLGGVSFVMWQSPDSLIDQLTTGFNDYKVNLVGEPFEVNFSGKSQNKLLIKDMEVIKNDDEEFFF